MHKPLYIIIAALLSIAAHYLAFGAADGLHLPGTSSLEGLLSEGCSKVLLECVADIDRAQDVPVVQR